jgi:putative transposase
MNTIQRAYKYRFYPTPEQAEQLTRTFGCARFVYNHFLRIRIDAWYEHQQRVGYNDTAKQLTELKKQPETLWLQEVSNVCLQQSLRNLDAAFRNFFQGRSKYPTFKKKHSRQSVRYTTNGFSYRDGQIKLAKQKEPLNIRWSRRFTGTPSSVTVSRDSAGRYHISILVEEEVEALPFSKQEVGIDLGLTHAVITSNGRKVNNHQYLKQSEKKLARAQRRLSRKKKGSANCAKAKLKVARIHARIADQRQDFAHKLTTQLIHENQVVAAESLQVKNMLKNHSLAKAISNVGWHQITAMLAYKAQWYGRDFVQIDKFYPSSKRCHVCGHISDAMPLSVRYWDCPSCGSHHDRDVNAAKNILKAGKAVLAGADKLREHEKTTVGRTGS